MFPLFIHILSREICIGIEYTLDVFQRLAIPPQKKQDSPQNHNAAISLGRRAAQWAQDLVMDLDDVEYVRAGLKFRGAQGTTGTQASFMEIPRRLIDSTKFCVRKQVIMIYINDSFWIHPR